MFKGGDTKNITKRQDTIKIPAELIKNQFKVRDSNFIWYFRRQETLKGVEKILEEITANQLLPKLMKDMNTQIQ